MFQMCGVFAEFERSMIQQRVVSGMARAKAAGVQFGRGNRKDDKRSKDEERWGMSRAELEKRILSLHKGGMGILKIGRTLGVGSGTVQGVLRPFEASASV
jgi:DNA invertase Pin-like site-specific DNA recombinase